MIISGEDEYYGLLNRYDINTHKYSITLLSDVEKIEKNAKVVTSGLGGVGKSPKGILVGTVENYTSGDDATESVCDVTPSVDFNELNEYSFEDRDDE